MNLPEAAKKNMHIGTKKNIYFKKYTNFLVIKIVVYVNFPIIFFRNAAFSRVRKVIKVNNVANKYENDTADI